ncbi:hypothetical protein EYC80_007755 [Monilinia laxa]|uniref:Uncharacterized protein n=1 Tax=Monilinia laxa TaxID=61186 RepID=A0A5N6JWX0_MONLA|nr:hypothetical protein EYC80_007755 [Monilinia laxa]
MCLSRRQSPAAPSYCLICMKSHDIFCCCSYPSIVSSVLSVKQEIPTPQEESMQIASKTPDALHPIINTRSSPGQIP